MFKERKGIQSTQNTPKTKTRRLSSHNKLQVFLDEVPKSIAGRLIRPVEGQRDNMGAKLDLWNKEWESMSERASPEGTPA